MVAAIRRKSGWKRSARRVAMAAQNALELIRVGRLTEPYSASFEVVHSDSLYSLRRYQGARAAGKSTSAPLILIPPLMIAAEVYDIAPDISAASTLVREGIDAWVIDFGAPERLEGGMQRTLDDHIRAVVDAVERAREASGRDVHLAGYSQGGMFAYQAAAYRRSEGLASVITFGSPVDIHRTVPNLSDSVAEHIVDGLRFALGAPIDRVEGLPGVLTSTGFKLVAARKELGQFVDFIRKLHNRQELEKREAKRLFLRGAGFVAWPGPAFRTFVDEFIVANRMATGGIVIDGKSVTLADIRCPILYFVGERDTMGTPPAVRAIHRAAPNAEVFESTVKAGHFGLVVGSAAMTKTWPTVIDWIRWRDGFGPRPGWLPQAPPQVQYDPEDLETIDETAFDIELAVDVFSKLGRAAWERLGEKARGVVESIDQMRYQVPRLSQLRSIEPGTRVSFGLALDEQAREIPDRTFFLWRGRAFSYAVANGRVDNVVRGLIACDVKPSDRVGLLMRGRPSYLSLVAAVNRLGAVVVMLNPKTSDAGLDRALASAGVTVLVTDPDHARRGRARFKGKVLALGGGAKDRQLVDDVVDMEAIDPGAVKLPSWYEPNPGRAGDLAMIIMSKGREEEPRASMVTNHRWAFSALGAAAAATLTSKDTVYACLPLHHAAGTMVAVGSALVGGSRLALASGFSPDTFWSEARRYGATVVFYAGEMCRLLVDAPQLRSEKNHPVRLFAGSGMRRDVWERLIDRFGPLGVLEFYASTQTNAVLGNASGEKIGALGGPLPGSSELAIAAFDFEEGELLRGPDGFCIACGPDQPGLLMAKLDPVEARMVAGDRVLRGVFTPGDAWHASGDILRKDVDGDYWFVDRVADLVTTSVGRQPSRPIEDALYRVPGVGLAAAYRLSGTGTRDALVADVVAHEGASLDAAQLTDRMGELPQELRPAIVRVVAELPMTDGFQPVKASLRAAGRDKLGDCAAAFRYLPDEQRYQSVSSDEASALVARG